MIVVVTSTVFHQAFGLSRSLDQPEINFPKGYEETRAKQIHSILRSDKFKYLDGIISYWEPKWSTTLVYGGDRQALNNLITALNRVSGINVRLTFSSDLSEDTGSGLKTGSWWIKYSHTIPDTLTIRINLAAEELGGDQFELWLPK